MRNQHGYNNPIYEFSGDINEISVSQYIIKLKQHNAKYKFMNKSIHEFIYNTY